LALFVRGVRDRLRPLYTHVWRMMHLHTCSCISKLTSRISHPTPNQPTVSVSKTFRFKSALAVTGSAIRPIDLCSVLVVATTANELYRLCNNVRLRSVEIWGPPAADLTPVTVSVEWGGGEGYAGASRRITDTSMGSTMPAHVRALPPRGSMAGLWHVDTSTGTLATIICPINSIVDVHVDVTFHDDGLAAPCLTGSIGGATVGAIYMRALTSDVPRLSLLLWDSQHSKCVSVRGWTLNITGG